MKKVILVIACVFSIGFLSSCTDNTLKGIERNEQSIDKKDIEPGDRG
mgnify:CR=1 FL=1